MPLDVLLKRTYAFAGGSVLCTISMPLRTAPEQAACEVVMGHHPPRMIYGLDEMQAVGLSIRFIEQTITVFTGDAEWRLVDKS